MTTIAQNERRGPETERYNTDSDMRDPKFYCC